MFVRFVLASLLLGPVGIFAQEALITHPDLKPATYSSCHVDGMSLAMTFDDGPSAENTPRLLDLLKQRGIKATFFLIGQNAAEHPELVKRILAEGHEVGNHSWTHPQLSKLSDERVSEEINKTQDAIRQASGFTPALLRPPYGALTQRQREWVEKDFHLNVILWSVDPFDWKRPGASVIEQRILTGAEPGAIILSHDIHKQTVDAMPATLDALLAKGYKFVTVSQLIAMNHPKPAGAPPPAVTQGDAAEKPAPRVSVEIPAKRAVVTTDATTSPSLNEPGSVPKPSH